MKRRSERSKSRGQHEPLTYFSDRDLAKRFPRILRDSGLSIVGYSDPEAFPDDDEIEDRKWIRFACRQGWVCLTHDHAVRKDGTLDEVFRDWEKSGALFILRGGIPTPKLAEMFLEVRPRVERMVRQHRKRSSPFIAAIRRAKERGAREVVRVRRSYDREEWEKYKRNKIR